MKIKLCAIFLLVSLLTGIFCACGGKAESEKPTKLSSVYNVKWTPDAPANTLTNISELNTSLNTESDGSLALFIKEENGNKIFNVYSLESNSVVYTKTVSLTSADNVSLVCGQIIDLSSDEYFLYDKTGKKITEGKGATTLSTKANLIVLDDTVYRINDYTYEIEDSFTYSPISGELPEFTYWNDDYYYLESDNDLFVYNNKCELINVYTVPGSAYKYDFFYLYDGSVMVQYATVLANDTEKYDILSAKGDTRYDLHTVVIDPKDGDTKEYEVSWVAVDVIVTNDKTDFDFLDNSVKNIAVVHTISDYHVGDSTQIYSIDSKCKVKGNLSNQLAGQDALLIPLGNEKFFCELRNGSVYLIDKNGKNLGAINNYKGYNTHYIATETAVYDYSLNKVIDMDDMKLSDMTSELLFFTDEETGKCTAVKSDGTTITVANGNSTSFAGVIEGDIYVIHHLSEGTYSYYDASGNLLVSGISGTLSLVSEYENRYIFVGLSTEDITSYYIAYTK